MNIVQTGVYEAGAIYHHQEDAVFHAGTTITRCIMMQASDYD